MRYVGHGGLRYSANLRHIMYLCTHDIRPVLGYPYNKVLIFYKLNYLTAPEFHQYSC